MPSRYGSSFVDLQAVQIGDEPAVLRICFNYSGKDWLFVKTAKLVCGDKTLEFEFTQPLRDNAGGLVWERESFTLGSLQIEQIRKIILGQSDGTLIFTGDKYVRDVEIDAEDLHRMIAVHDRWAINEGKPLIASLRADEEVPVAEPEPEEKPMLKRRVFTDSTGTFKITATFIRVSGANVMLEKEDGKQVELPLARLSETDQKWVKDAGSEE